MLSLTVGSNFYDAPTVKLRRVQTIHIIAITSSAK
jgi:hypothetical protein